MNINKNIFWGILFIAIGVILILNVLNIFYVDIFFKGWWTFIIIIPCFIGIFKRESKFTSLIGLIIGVSLLLCCWNILDIDLILDLTIPVILVILGISFILKERTDRKINININKIYNDKNNNDARYSTFSSKKINYSGEVFEGENLEAVFGSIKLDLRNAIINENQVIKCSAIFANIVIYVPNNVNIQIKSNSIFGGVKNKRNVVFSGINDKIIYIDSTCIFGGVDIK